MAESKFDVAVTHFQVRSRKDALLTPNHRSGYPTRQSLGQALLAAGKAPAARPFRRETWNLSAQRVVM
jgi:hypothetical protein